MDAEEARALLLMDDGLGSTPGRALARAVERGACVRIRRGVYLESAVWAALTKEERLLVRLVALASTAVSRPVFSGWSAALLHGLPVPRRATDLVDVVVDGNRNRTVAQARVHRFALDASEVVEVSGLLCTSLLGTTVDLAADADFEEAVVVADVALAQLGPDGRRLLGDALDLSTRRRGAVRAQQVLDFADPRSGSPGESISRVRMHRRGFVRPELQVPIVSDGLTDFADFGWEEVGGVGEFDGEVKYRLDRYRRGRTVEEVVIDEKNRENRIRRQRPRFARWDWSDLMAERLEAILRSAGIPKRGDPPPPPGA